MYAPEPSGRRVMESIISFLAIVGLITIFSLGVLLGLLLGAAF